MFTAKTITVLYNKVKQRICNEGLLKSVFQFVQTIVSCPRQWKLLTHQAELRNLLWLKSNILDPWHNYSQARLIRRDKISNRKYRF